MYDYFEFAAGLGRTKVFGKWRRSSKLPGPAHPRRHAFAPPMENFARGRDFAAWGWADAAGGD